ncbi:hypothetical protein [Nocardioides sp. CER19]|uniref:hypothetical protein n=1 Tax=Nocardioides sp. CER19 TaxID=3038538 RepID=UPI00244A3FE3|nr:hypothetical protein [Nocardioides sp. CER19]MDH2413163.1 hypothetical protein [Nocardioides sp. CER19]
MGTRTRWGVLVVTGLVAAVGGFAIASVTGPGEHRTAVATPVPAQPELPVDPSTPPAQDIDYPALPAGLTYQPQTLGHGAFTWDYAVPSRWKRYGADENLLANEYRWRPPDEPTVGGFSVRVKLVNTHQTPAEMVAAKKAALAASPDAYADFTVVTETSDTLGFTYRVPSSNTLRYNTFHWITQPGEDEAGVEMSVAGRERDRAGLADLLSRVSASFRLR